MLKASSIGAYLRALVAFGAVIAALAVIPATASAAPAGALSQLGGQDGCLSTSGNTFNCAAGSAVKESTSTAVSPDDRNVYVAATDSGIEVLSRNTSSGAVSQLPGKDGCVTGDGRDDNGVADACGTASGLGSYSGDGPNYITVSPDGKTVYATNGGIDTLMVFERDTREGPSFGALKQVQCLRDTDTSTTCTKVEPGYSFDDLHAVTVSSDGAHVYAVSGEGGSNGAVFAFDRAADGTLTVPSAAKTHCVTLTGRNASGTPNQCRTARALKEPYHLALSSDGKQLYVASSEGDTTNGNGAVVTLSVQSDGSLSQPSGPAGCLDGSGSGDASDPTACAQGKPGMHDLNGVAVSPDGKSVYGAAAGNGGTSTPGAVEILSRDPATGSLTQDVATPAGCISVNGTDGNNGTAMNTCDKARGIEETYRITVSPDGGVVYVASQGNNSSTAPGTISVFSRASSGALTQLSDQDGCVSNATGADSQGGNTCAHGRALNGAYQLALSSDCTSAYVASQDNPKGLAVFSRQPCLAPLATTDPASAVTTVSATLNGTVNPRGSSTSVVFVYGTSTAYGSTTPTQSAGDGRTAAPVSANLSGLTPSTTYHYRVEATNAYGRAVGADRTFTTAAAPLAPAIARAPVKCVVPKLKHKTLAQAKKLIAKNHCRLGKVSASAAARRRGKLRVTKSSPKAGTVLPSGARVSVRLGSAARPAAPSKPHFTG
ncbi:MAG: hypothetical protein NVSMB25_13100 [Thermoleophilaceae bacterium]